jgi:type I restriction enzyme S subunit
MELITDYKQQEHLICKKHLPRFNGKWIIKQIGDFTSCTGGGTPSTFIPTYWGGEFRWMNSGELHRKFVNEVEGRITQEGLRNSSTKMIPKKCVLVGLAGQGKTRGTVAINLVELCTNQSIAAIFPSPEHVPEYLYYNLEFRYDELRSLSSGEGGRGGLNLTIIKSILVPLPEQAEQRAIAAALSDVDALIAALDRLIAKKRDIKQATMQELLTGKRRLPHFNGKWKNCLLGEVIEDCTSGATPHRSHPDYYKGKVKWITSGELNYNRIFDTIEHISEEAAQKTNLKMHPVGTFLMAITGLEAAGTRGACGIVGSPATTNQSCMAIYPTSELKTEYLFHYYVFSGNALALRYCQGTKQQSYTAKLVRLLPIELPPTVEEQVAIATVLNDMDAEIVALKSRRGKIRDLKQGMMQELLTGRIRLVKGAEA